MYPTNSPSQGTNVFDTASSAYSSGVGGMNFAMNPMAVPFTMNQFANPYREQVITDSLGRLRDRRNSDLNMVQGQAHQAGAFGGARHGLVEAQLFEDYGRQEDEMAFRMLQDGFDTSSNLALQRLGQIAQTGSSMVGAAPTGFSLGQGALGMQQQAGMQQRSMAQQILDLASGQFQGNVTGPQTSLQTALSGIMGNPMSAAQTQTQSFQPGLFNYLQLGAGMYGAGK